MPHEGPTRAQLSRGSTVAVSISVTAGRVVGPAPNRVALILGAPLAGTITYLTSSPSGIGSGFNVNSGAPPLIVAGEAWGDLPQQEWFAIADGAGRNAAVAEVMAAPGAERISGKA